MTQPDEILDIQTPENVAFGYQVAGIGSRFLATLLDTVIVILLQIAAFAAVFLILRAFNVTPRAGGLGSWIYAVFGLVAFIFYWGYYIFFEMLWNGQTPGKRWTGLRVIRGDGSPLSLSESLIRNLARIVDMLPAAYGVGVITMFIDRQSRRLGDLAAGTLVVHDRAPISIQSLSLKRSLNFGMQGLTKVSLDGFPVDRLTDDDLSLIEGFLLRRDQLTHRNSLAIQILNTLHQRLGLPPSAVSRLEAEDTLVAILRAARRPEE